MSGTRRYVTKVHPKSGPVLVEAEQFTVRLDASEAAALADRFGGTFSTDSSYWAIDFPRPSSAHARPSDYLVRHADGSVVVLPADVFEARFEVVPGRK